MGYPMLVYVGEPVQLPQGMRDTIFSVVGLQLFDNSLNPWVEKSYSAPVLRLEFVRLHGAMDYGERQLTSFMLRDWIWGCVLNGKFVYEVV